MKLIMKLILTLIILVCVCIKPAICQVELVSEKDPVYEFLKRQQVSGFIPDYNSSNLPQSREVLSSLLSELYLNVDKLSRKDVLLLKMYLLKLGAETTGDSVKNLPLKQKNYRQVNELFSSSDSNASIKVNFVGGGKVMNFSGAAYENSTISFAGGGLNIHGTLLNSFGYFLTAENYVKLSGSNVAREYARLSDPIIYSDWKFDESKINYYSPFTGYLRYRTPSNIFGVTVGRFAVTQGRGYIDKLFLSQNFAPFDLIKVDLNYKALNYSFLYGALRGDSAGINKYKLNSKNIASHRLDVKFGKKFSMGLYESVIIPNSSFNLTFLNPISVLSLAEINKASQGVNDNDNNSILGMDMEYFVFKNVSVQYSLLVDDIDWSTLFKSNDVSNKFGYQVGMYVNNLFSVPALTLRCEYTRLNPFIYTHISNKSQYTHWDLPLGHLLKPNSDEIAFKMGYDFLSSLQTDLTFRYQRHADGIIYDSNGQILLNYGGNINNGLNLMSNLTGFLKGTQVNSSVFEFNTRFEPVSNLYINFYLKYVLEKNIQNNTNNNSLNCQFSIAFINY